MADCVVLAIELEVFPMLLSRAGQAKLTQELGDLRSKLLAGNREAAHQYETGGDQWHDNFGWDNARRENGILTGRIERLERELNRSHTIIDDMPRREGVVSPGMVVQITTAEGATKEFTILGDLEADPASNVFSHTAPLPQALIGRHVGERVIFNGKAVTITCVRPWEGLLPQGA